jgi:predicted ATPase
MIKTLWLQNYGPFKLAELELRPLTVLVGPNASGKSIALGALASQKHSEMYLEGMRNRGSSEPVAVGWRIEANLPGKERTPSKTIVWSSPEDIKKLIFIASEVEVQRHLRSSESPDVIHLQLQPSALRQSSYVNSSSPVMREDGYGLATALAYMKLGDTKNFDSLIRRVRAIVPTFEDLRFMRASVQDTEGRDLYGDELIFDMAGAHDLSPKFVSDGTLFTLGLLTSLMQHSSGSCLFLIDEIERGLHPRALGELISHLRQLAVESDVQIVATSHSPYLLDALEPDEVRLTGFLEDGSTTIRKLSDHPEFERWKDEMTPGEIWSTVGEDWIK